MARIRYFDEDGDELEPIEDDEQYPRGAKVTVEGYRGVAWWVDHIQPEDNSRVACVMVGDDRRFTFERSELAALAREDYCGECGQIGCTHDGLVREV
jgi:hypothetical protein